MKRINQKTLAISAAILAALSIITAGCASGAKSSAMVPQDLNTTVHHAGSVSVQVDGGNKTNPLWKSEISSEDFSSALMEAMKESGVFATVAGAGTDYRLEVHLIKVLNPNAGLTLTTTVVAQWQLFRARDSAVVSDEYIATPFSATVGDAFVAIKRLRLANEGAARANIAEGIHRLEKLNL